MKLFVLAAFGATLTSSGALADQFGVATYYHNPNHGGLIAAHLTLPFGTHVRVYNLDNGRNVVVTIVDRGPYATTGRIIDLSTVASVCAKRASRESDSNLYNRRRADPLAAFQQASRNQLRPDFRRGLNEVESARIAEDAQEIWNAPFRSLG